MTFIARALVGPVAVPAAYAAAAKAKAKRDRESYAAFRTIDQAEHDKAHERRVTSAVAVAEDEVRLWRLDAEDAEPVAAEALATFRAAEDRSREACEFARQQRVAYERVKGKGSAQEETDALVLADTADTVAFDAAKVMEEKQVELAGADRALAEAREGLAEAERQLVKARKAAEVPAGTAPISDTTIRACADYMQGDEVWDTLSRADKQRVQRLAEPRDIMSAQEWQAMMREVLEVGGGAA
jgi:hypothetical protein